jgi:hypothetical protein
VERKDIVPADAPIHRLFQIRLLQLHLPLPMEPTLFLLLLSRTMLVRESTMFGIWCWATSMGHLLLQHLCP